MPALTTTFRPHLGPQEVMTRLVPRSAEHRASISLAIGTSWRPASREEYLVGHARRRHGLDPRWQLAALRLMNRSPSARLALALAGRHRAAGMVLDDPGFPLMLADGLFGIGTSPISWSLRRRDV